MVTLLSKSKSVGGYGAISMQYSEVFNRDAFVFGARGAVVLSHIFAIGLGGCGFVTDFERYNDYTRQGYAGGYGGLVMEPIILPRFPVHISVPILIGAGGVAYTSYESDFDEDANVISSDAFLVVEPGVELEMNVTKFFRFAAGGYYRLTSDIDLMDENSLNGLSVGITLKFGKF
ncbi:MAG: hypothetical protein HC906_10265 [Bacteroidales bacterium]|nr:hypothetical protein [Bacteroidales bacterium]